MTIEKINGIELSNVKSVNYVCRVYDIHFGEILTYDIKTIPTIYKIDRIDYERLAEVINFNSWMFKSGDFEIALGDVVELVLNNGEIIS